MVLKMNTESEDLVVQKIVHRIVETPSQKQGHFSQQVMEGVARNAISRISSWSKKCQIEKFVCKGQFMPQEPTLSHSTGQ